MTDYQSGDRVRLIRPFVWSGSTPEANEYWDEKIRRRVPDLIGTFMTHRAIDEAVLINWDGYHLTCDTSCIDLADPPPPEEIEKAVSSIMETANRTLTTDQTHPLL